MSSPTQRPGDRVSGNWGVSVSGTRESMGVGTASQCEWEQRVGVNRNRESV